MLMIHGRTGLKRVIPDCLTGRILIQSNIRTGEPELHYLKLPQHIKEHDGVLLLDPQVSRKIPFQINISI
jgi:uridine kinase